MINREHYFDWAATSPADKDILMEAADLTLNNFGNPSSQHQCGKEAKSLFEEARERAAKAMGVKASQIFFTSGGTESDHLALLSLLSRPAGSQKGRILVSSIEHPALREEALAMKKLGYDLQFIPADKLGIIRPEAVEKLLTSDTLFVTVMAVNNETGSIQPIYEIADLLTRFYEGKRRPKFHVDCVQAAGKIPLNISYKGIDSAAFSSHKICGPRGIGLLYLADKEKFEGFLRGGGQEGGVRSGTENILGAVAFSKCLERYFNADHTEMAKVSCDFVKNLAGLKGCTIVPEGRLKNTELFSPYVVQAAFANIPGNVMLRALDSKGFYISTGSACSAKKASRPVLEAMLVPADIRETAVRFSFGPHTTQKAVEELFEAVSEVNRTFNK